MVALFGRQHHRGTCRRASGISPCWHPFNLAVKLKVTRDGTTYTGDAALALDKRDAYVDGLGNNVPAEWSGLGHLLRLLSKSFMIHDDDYNDIIRDSFFEHRRDNADCFMYLNEHILNSRVLLWCRLSFCC